MTSDVADIPATRSGAEEEQRPGAGGRLADARLSRFSGLALWALFVLIFAIWVPDTFLTSATAKSIAGDQAITVILALAVLVVLVTGGFDLSLAQNLGLSAVTCSALMVNSGLSPAPAALLTIGMGVVIGAVNGLLVARAGVNSFIATLGMSSVLLALTSVVSDQQFLGPLPESFQDVAAQDPLGVPVVTVYAIVLAGLCWYLLEHTPVGRRMHATGAGPDAARLAGVRTGKLVFWSFVAAGGIASLAGVLLAARIGQVGPDVGPSYLLPAFAACFLGTTQLKLGRFNVWGTVLALYLLATGVKGLQLAGGQTWITDMFNGVALVGAVTIAVLGEKRRAKAVKARTARA